MKPLNIKAYGSIPHLPGSNLGEGDHLMNPGQAAIMTDQCRKGDLIMVTEKYDGSCVAVARHLGHLVPLTRSGYLAETSAFHQHHVFAKWVYANEERFEALKEGERIVGEWLMQVHAISYVIDNRMQEQPIVWFDYFDNQNNRHPFNVYADFVVQADLNLPRLFHIGDSISVKDILAGGGSEAAVSGSFWEGDPYFKSFMTHPEGLVYRCLRENKETDFLGKWVRPDFEPGKFMYDKIYNLTETDILS